MPYWFTGRSGESVDGKTFHYDRSCDRLDEPSRPITESSIPDESKYCGHCSQVADAPESDSGESGGDDPPTDGEDVPDVTPVDPEDTETLIDAGVCPWCDDYEGEHVGQHASSAHPDDWDEYKA